LTSPRTCISLHHRDNPPAYVHCLLFSSLSPMKDLHERFAFSKDSKITSHGIRRWSCSPHSVSAILPSSGILGGIFLGIKVANKGILSIEIYTASFSQLSPFFSIVLLPQYLSIGLSSSPGSPSHSQHQFNHKHQSQWPHQFLHTLPPVLPS
jgi:hypothetical protein